MEAAETDRVATEFNWECRLDGGGRCPLDVKELFEYRIGAMEHGIAGFEVCLGHPIGPLNS